MSERPLERCYTCDEPTGRAGRSDDSIYCESCHRGPFCVGCFEEHVEGQVVIDTVPGKNMPGIRCPEDL